MQCTAALQRSKAEDIAQDKKMETYSAKAGAKTMHAETSRNNLNILL